MNFVELLKDHALILAATKSLTGITRSPLQRAEAAHDCLRQLARLLESHLRAEAEFIRDDSAIGHHEFAALAEEHGARFDDLVSEWGSYLNDWTEDRIRADWAAFVWETDWIVERLNEQVEAENASLYPAALRYGLIRLLPPKTSAAVG